MNKSILWILNSILKTYPSLFLILFIIGTISGYYYLKSSAFTRVKENLSESSEQIRSTLIFREGKWDISLYNNHPLTPHPTGSSGPSHPLYIITRDGFVIERNQPINGFLDSSDFRHLLEFQQPKTIDGITNERWRVFSKPIKKDNEILAVVMTAFYDPNSNEVSKIDQILHQNIEEISTKIQIVNNQISTNKLDIRNAHYNVAFEVVNNFNKMLINNGRIPTFIDNSYLVSEIESLGKYKVIQDIKTEEPFLTYRIPLVNSSNQIEGIIITARSVSSIESMLQDYKIISFILTFVLMFLTIIFYVYSIPQKVKPKQIFFDKDKSRLIINNNPIEIPYASNQFYLLEALFKNLNKRWETDQLLERFGIRESKNGWRTIYDTSLSINKKSGIKLIQQKDKTFQINPTYISLIKKK